jgi:mannose-6-phosphate isomerase-like protein (cupin superfamily)
MTTKRYAISQLDELPRTPCPCGTARRAFGDEPEGTATIHLVDIAEDARAHYHAEHTEIYVILEGEGHLELDGELVPVRPLTTVMIKAGCRHRAIGPMRILNVPVPAFDLRDELFD